MKTITVSLDKNLGYISDAMFSLLTELFEKTNPAVLQISKDEAEKIISDEKLPLTGGALILSRNDNTVVSTYQAVAELEYYAKKYRLTGMIEKDLKSAERILSIEHTLKS